MKRLAKLLTKVALIQMILSAVQNTLEARRSSMQESRRVKIAENTAKRNWEAWQQARAEAEHWQQAAERADQQRMSWQEARDEALALQRAREQARQLAAQQRCTTATVQKGARATAEWLQDTSDEAQKTASHWWQQLWAALVFTDRMGAVVLDEAARGIADLSNGVAHSKQVKAARQGMMRTWAQYGWGKARARRIARQRRTQRLNTVAIGAGVAALAWYFLDPETGSQRRGQMRDRVMTVVRNGQDKLDSTLSGGMGVSDSQVARDVATPVAASRPAGIMGQSPAQGSLGDMYRGGAMASSGSLASGLTGGASGPVSAPESWPLGVRVLAGLAGGVLMVTGLGFRGAPGIGGRAVGAGLLARALTNMPFRRLVRRGSGSYDDGFGSTAFPRSRTPQEIEIGRSGVMAGSSLPDVSPSIDIVNPAHADLRTGNLETLESQTSLSMTGDTLVAGSAVDTASAVDAGTTSGPMPGSSEAAQMEAEAAVRQIGAAADPDVAARGIDLDEEAGEREIPLGHWQAFFDEIGRDYGNRIVAVERANGARIAELPLLGASVNLRPDGRDVRLLLGTNLGAHMDHLVENVRSLIVLPGRGAARGFRLETADGATTVSPLTE